MAIPDSLMSLRQQKGAGRRIPRVSVTLLQTEPSTRDPLFSFLLLRSLQSDDEGDLQLEFRSGLDDTLGNNVASHDASKDVDKDGAHRLLPQQELERLLDRIGSGRSSDVEEVGRVASVELEHVHGRHRETGAVDEASDVAVELDKVETVLGSLDLLGYIVSDRRLQGTPT